MNKSIKYARFIHVNKGLKTKLKHKLDLK